MLLFLLTFGLGLLPGMAAWFVWRGPRVEESIPVDSPGGSLPEMAVLRDGAIGATRWAFAALVLKLAREGHCTLVRTRQRRWVRTVPVWTVDLHTDPTALSSFEQTVLRQLGRHDTLDGFGFAGSTFRRRTLRDVRADLIERGWLADRHRRSNGGLALGLGLFVTALFAGLSPLLGAAAAGLGVGSLVAALPRFPRTEEGARHRAVHRAYAQRQYERLQEHLSEAPERAAGHLVGALPHLVVERIVTPRGLNTVANRLDAAEESLPAPDWIRDESEEISSFADGCRRLGGLLTSLGARPVRDLFRLS